MLSTLSRSVPSRRAPVGLLRGALLGAAAGAAGTTALNATTYLDMVLRGRPVSSTPEETVQRLSDTAHIPIPGDAKDRQNRLSGLGALSGLVAGVAAGGFLGIVRAGGWRPRPAVGVLAATTGALLVGNVPMTLFGVTDPRTWSAGDWAADVVPHVAYGVVTAAVLSGLDPS
jgi:hypothetical protein